MQCPKKPGKGVGSPGTGVTDGYEPPLGCWGLKPGLLCKISKCTYILSHVSYPRKSFFYLTLPSVTRVQAIWGAEMRRTTGSSLTCYNLETPCLTMNIGRGGGIYIYSPVLKAALAGAAAPESTL